MRKAAISSCGAAAVVIAGVSTGAASADVILNDVQWQFYQGGYAQESPGQFIVAQAFFDNVESNNVVQEMGGASFASQAFMQVVIEDTADLFRLGALNTLIVSAAVDEGWPLGLAQAFASLSLFFVEFGITDGMYLYTGSEKLVDNDGVEYASGSTVGPGVYNFLELNLGFPLLMTDLVGEGESQELFAGREFLFEFTAIPAPAGILLVAAGLLPMRRRRR